MKELTLEEKIKIINQSKNLEDISISALPKVFGSSYFFVSYSHKDYKKVYVDILKLQEAGINIWYDRGLEAGKSWEDYADEAISKYNCIGVIFYLSENALTSKAIEHEIRYVKMIGKDFLSINLPIEFDEKTKDKVLPVSQMLKLNSVKKNIEEANYSYINKVFNDTVIYLDYNSPTEFKAEKINSLKKPALFNYEKVSYTSCKLLSINSIDFKKIEIPYSTIINDSKLRITSIADCAFANCKFLEEIILPPTIDDLGDNTFFNCQLLKEIKLPRSTKSIGNSIFENCTNLKSVIMYDHLESIGDFAFDGCNSLENIVLPSGLKKLGIGAFRGTSLETITMISNDSLYYYIDNGCIIYKQEQLEKYNSKKKVLKALKKDNLYKKIIMGGVSKNGTTLSITADEVGMYSYSKCPLKTLTIPDNITLIDEYSFEDCQNLESIIFTNSNIPAKKEKTLFIHNSAFKNCKSLKSMNFPQRISTIGFDSFRGCKSLSKITFENNSKLTQILDYAFRGCSSLEEIIIPASVKRIGTGAFENCFKLKKVTFEEGSCLTTIDEDAFKNCYELKEINLPNSLTSLKNSIFENCRSLEIINIPNSIKTIYCPFINCEKIKKINFGKGSNLKYILKNAFDNLDNIEINYPLSKRKWMKINQLMLKSSMKNHNKNSMNYEKYISNIPRIEEKIKINFKEN